jgi:hypothetical protein
MAVLNQGVAGSGGGGGGAGGAGGNGARDEHAATKTRLDSARNRRIP